MSKPDDLFDSVSEKAKGATYELWSSLLTAHTVLLSLSAALPLASTNANICYLKTISYLNLVSIVTLIFNFAAMRMQYVEMGKTILRGNEQLTDEVKKRNIRKARRRHTAIAVSEAIASIGFVLSALILVFFAL